MNRHRKNGPYIFSVCRPSNAHAQSPIWVTDVRFCLKLSEGLYYISANSKGFGDTALVACMISTRFSCVDSNIFFFI